MKPTPLIQDKTTPDTFQPSSPLDWLFVVCAFAFGMAIGDLLGYSSAVNDVSGWADLGAGGAAAREQGGQAAPLGNHGEINSVVPK